MHTNMEEDYFKGKVCSDAISVSEDKYIYKLSKDSSLYVLKGYKISMPSTDDPEARSSYAEGLRELGLIYQEFYLAKIDNTFNPHYVRPLHLATNFTI